MIVNNLSTMEEIVEKNHNLHWDGWTVVETRQSEAAKTSPAGIYRNGKWFLAKKFVPEINGWDIPSRYRV